ncbi:MAG TPA: DUF1761 domain-containing protein [Candidatus Limnocylindria bacterium]|nr:DUF1761 domain-containing protein [Candidatus Limnocylindria bacterium]
MPVAEINYLAVLVAGVLSMAIGFLWYSLVFSRAWMQESKLTAKDIGNGPGAGYALVTVGSLLQAYVLAHFIDFTNATTWVQGATTGIWIWTGFVGTAYAATYVFSKRSLKLWTIDAGYFLAVLMAQGALLGAWV